jgi:putative FmdB family regulatory protein
MPIYEYLCDDCGARYERIVMSKATKIACPKCESGRHTLQLSVFSAPAKGNSAEPSANGGLPAGPCCGMGGCGCN